MKGLKILLLGSVLIILLLAGTGCESVRPNGSDIMENRRPIQNRMEDERERWVAEPSRPESNATLAAAVIASGREKG